jgi:type VI secretion system secreted protein Hcp
MPVPAYLTLTGKDQGPIEGSCDQQGHEGEIIVETFNHEITIPRDIQTGQPTGTSFHGPLTITKFFDKSSPKLYVALSSGERMEEVVIKWYQIDLGGAWGHYFTTWLEGAVIVSIKPSMENCLDPANGPFGHMEDVSFTYQRIIWTWELGRKIEGEASNFRAFEEYWES